MWTPPAPSLRARLPYATCLSDAEWGIVALLLSISRAMAGGAATSWGRSGTGSPRKSQARLDLLVTLEVGRLFTCALPSDSRSVFEAEADP